MGEKVLPSRVLEISRWNDELIIRLKTSITPDDRYIALSYCWGQCKNSIRLLLENLVDLQKGVSTTFLPKTFKDAVTVANSIGCLYLWIDALCIIQNSDSDKLRELAKMQGIYQNSFLTIAAADGQDSHAGILCSRESVLSTQVRGSDAAQRSVSVHLRTRRSSEKHTAGQSRLEPHLEGPLNSRAWSLQERLLPCRILHYCDTQLVWECYSITSCEGRLPASEIEVCYDEGKLELFSTFFFNTKSLPAIMRSHALDGEHQYFYILWNYILKKYTDRHLTFNCDKISAIKGIAELISGRTEDTLIHGLWEKHVAACLVWEVEDGEHTKVQSTNLSVPSWSWAKTHGVIWTPPAEVGIIFSLVDTSQMKEGVLLITGPCDRISARIVPRSHRRYCRFDQGSGLEFHTEVHLDNNSRFRECTELNSQLDPSEDFPQSRADILCLVIWGKEKKDDCHYGEMYGLVLIERGNSGTFERIGAFHTPGYRVDGKSREMSFETITLL